MLGAQSGGGAFDATTARGHHARTAPPTLCVLPVAAATVLSGLNVRVSHIFLLSLSFYHSELGMTDCECQLSTPLMQFCAQTVCMPSATDRIRFIRFFMWLTMCVCYVWATLNSNGLLLSVMCAKLIDWQLLSWRHTWPNIAAEQMTYLIVQHFQVRFTSK